MYPRYLCTEFGERPDHPRAAVVECFERGGPFRGLVQRMNAPELRPAVVAQGIADEPVDGGTGSGRVPQRGIEGLRSFLIEKLSHEALLELGQTG